MKRRFISICFRHLTTDWQARRQADLREAPFVLAAPERGRMVIKAVSIMANALGIQPGTVVADARAIYPSLLVLDDEPERAGKLLGALAEWCIRYTPVVAVDLPDGLIMDCSGCTHLWGGEQAYVQEIKRRFEDLGYHIAIALADTIGMAWAIARYGGSDTIVASGGQTKALSLLPPASLRLEQNVVERMHKLGLYRIGSFIDMPRSVLRMRFGQFTLTRLAQALGEQKEPIVPVQPVPPYQERLPCLEPIRTATGIEIALRQLLETLCQRLLQESKGLRSAWLQSYRIDGKTQRIDIGTSSPSRNVAHLFKLFALKIGTIAPGLGIELFVLEAPVVEDLSQAQETLWNLSQEKDNTAIANLLDRIAARVGFSAIHRYLPDEHHWPERSIKLATSLAEKSCIAWRSDLPRPVSLLAKPEPITVTVPIPDYPPLQFHYRGKLHRVRKADGPERIEPEWWLHQGFSQPLHRDYYCVEDEQGARYWLFRSGHYGTEETKWYLHGFFA